MGDAADMLRENEELLRDLHMIGDCIDPCPHCDREEKIGPGTIDELEDLDE